MNFTVKQIKLILGIVAIAIVFMAAKGSSSKSKVGYVNSNKLWELMPEKKEADEKLKKMEADLVAYIQQEQKSLEQGILVYQKDSATMSDLIKKQTVQKLLQQQDNIKTMPEQANEEMLKEQEKLYAPIREKLQKAIDDVAAENGFDIILDLAYGNIIYAKNESDNIFNLVKSELNLQK